MADGEKFLLHTMEANWKGRFASPTSPTELLTMVQGDIIYPLSLLLYYVRQLPSLVKKNK